MATKKIIAEQVKRIISTGSSRFDDNVDLRELMKLIDGERDRMIKEEIIIKRNAGDFSINSQYLTSRNYNVRLRDYKTPHPYWITDDAIATPISLPNDLEIYDISYRVFGSNISPSQFSWVNANVPVKPMRKPSNAGVLYDDPTIYNFIEGNTYNTVDGMSTAYSNWGSPTGENTAFTADTPNSDQSVTNTGSSNVVPDGYNWTNRMNKPTTSYIRNHFWEYTPGKRIKITNISQPYVYNATSSDASVINQAGSSSPNQVLGTVGTLSRSSQNPLGDNYIGWDVISYLEGVTGAVSTNGNLSQTGQIFITFVAKSEIIGQDDLYPIPADMISTIVNNVSKIYLQAGASYPQKYE
jgi:hypothetical protein